MGSLDLAVPSAAYLVGVVMFSFIGFAAFRFGRKTSRFYVTWIGLALMLYPYVVSETWLVYAVGMALCVGLYLFRQQD